MSSNFIGAVISIFGSIIGNIGMNTQKQAHVNNNRKPVDEQVISPCMIPAGVFNLSSMHIV
jgi:hypothetical protein